MSAFIQGALANHAIRAVIALSIRFASNTILVYSQSICIQSKYNYYLKELRRQTWQNTVSVTMVNRFLSLSESENRFYTKFQYFQGFHYDAALQACTYKENEINIASYNETCQFDADCDTKKGLSCSNNTCSCTNSNQRLLVLYFTTRPDFVQILYILVENRG